MTPSTLNRGRAPCRAASESGLADGARRTREHIRLGVALCEGALAEAQAVATASDSEPALRHPDQSNRDRENAVLSASAAQRSAQVRPYAAAAQHVRGL